MTASFWINGYKYLENILLLYFIVLLFHLIGRCLDIKFYEIEDNSKEKEPKYNGATRFFILIYNKLKYTILISF